MQYDIKIFFPSCLQCQSTIGGERVPRPMGHVIHADKLNELIHFDFLYMGESEADLKYMLTLKDDELHLYGWNQRKWQIVWLP